MLVYLVKSTICLAILLLFYTLLLEKEHMHVFKRFYLLAAVAIALTIPMVVFTEYVEVTPFSEAEAFSIVSGSRGENNLSAARSLQTEPLNIVRIGWGIYFMGVVFFGLKFLKNIVRIFRQIHKNPKKRLYRFTQVLLQENILPHTFFNYIFLNQRRLEANEIPQEVLLHEETHAEQKHSYDVIFIELLQIVFWFNPLIYLFNKAIKLNHEFLADWAVIKRTDNSKKYQKTLLAYVSTDNEKKYQQQLTNAINHSSYSSIKKRFTIMKAHTSKKAILFRSLLLLPIVSLLLYGFSETKIIPKEIYTATPIAPISNASVVPITIYINNNQEVRINEELVELTAISKKLIALLGASDTNTTPVQEIHLEATGTLSLTLLDAIREHIRKAGGHLKIVTAGTIKITETSFEARYKGTDFRAKDTLYVRTKKSGPIIGISSAATAGEPTPTLAAEDSQDGASRELMAEYTKLAKYYNTMPRNKMKILKKDVERLEYIYALMSEKQKADAEPFPDFPKPPAAPEAPKAPITPTEREEAAATIEKIIEEQDPYDVVGGNFRSIQIPKQEFQEQRTLEEVKLIERGEKMMNWGIKIEEQEAKMREQEIALKEKEMKLEKQEVLMRVEEEKMMEKETKMQEIEEKLQVPSPPVPKSPLDYVIEMAKTNAVFYYEGDKISSDKAIELVKKNKNINLDSSSSTEQAPVVRLSKKPIKIGANQKYQKSLHPTEKLQKVELVGLLSNIALQRQKVIQRLRFFKANYEHCTAFYFQGKSIPIDAALEHYLHGMRLAPYSKDEASTGLRVKC